VDKKPEALAKFAALAKLSPNNTMVKNNRDYYKSLAPESKWTLDEVW